MFRSLFGGVGLGVKVVSKVQIRFFITSVVYRMSKEAGNLTWMKNINDKGEFIRKVSSFRKWVTGIEIPLNPPYRIIRCLWNTTPNHGCRSTRFT